jgi:thiol-disulfide isomerase/thioredoxin
MSKHLVGVPHLEMEDFTPDMKLKPHVTRGKPVVVMAQGHFCGYCTQAKPAFAAFCKETTIVGATIQIDSEKDVGGKISGWDKTYRGVPFYLGFNSKGQYVKSHSGRDKASLLAFGKTLA